MGHYQVLFSGEVVEGAQEAQVRINLAHKFGLDDRKVGQLFSGRTVVIQSSMDVDEAYALQKELIDLGAVVRVKDLSPDERTELKVDSRAYKGDAPQSDYTLKDITAAHIECPRCGHMQLDSQSCTRCGIDMAAAGNKKRKEDRMIEHQLGQLNGTPSGSASRGSSTASRADRSLPRVNTPDRRRQAAPRKGLLRRLGFGRG